MLNEGNTELLLLTIKFGLKTKLLRGTYLLSFNSVMPCADCSPLPQTVTYTTAYRYDSGEHNRFLHYTNNGYTETTLRGRGYRRSSY